MPARKMCHDCPHLREHTVGDEVFVYTAGYPAGYLDKIHPCHNAIKLPCVGHQLQVDKMDEQAKTTLTNG
jgi:hypothetical protein